MDIADQIFAPHVHTFFVFCRVENDRMGFAFYDNKDWNKLRGHDKDIVRRRDYGFGNVFYEHFFFYVPLPPTIKWRGKYDCSVTIVAKCANELTPERIEQVKKKAADFIAKRQPE